MIGKDRYGCATRKRTGTCANSLTVKRENIEARILKAINSPLFNEEAITKFIKSYEGEWALLQNKQKTLYNNSLKDIDKVQKKLKHLLNAIEQGIITNTTLSRLHQLETEKETLLESLVKPMAVPNISKSLLNQYRKAAKDLSFTLNQTSIRTAAITLFQSLIDHITITPTEETTDILISFNLNPACNDQKKSAQASKLSAVHTSNKTSVVAGAGFEPATFRL